jgi:hypothetical protein
VKSRQKKDHLGRDEKQVVVTYIKIEFALEFKHKSLDKIAIRYGASHSGGTMLRNKTTYKPPIRHMEVRQRDHKVVEQDSTIRRDCFVSISLDTRVIIFMSEQIKTW